MFIPGFHSHVDACVLVGVFWGEKGQMFLQTWKIHSEIRTVVSLYNMLIHQCSKKGANTKKNMLKQWNNFSTP